MHTHRKALAEMKADTRSFWLPALLWTLLLQRGGRTQLLGGRRLAAQARTLTFLETAPTRVQFIGGIGIPVEDLYFESVTSGYVLKAEYFLPTKAEEFRPTYLRPQTIHRRSAHNASDSDVDVAVSSTFGDNRQSQQQQRGTTSLALYRWIVYRGIEAALNRSGMPGRRCLLRSICEHAALPLHYESGILAEVLNIILTPSSSRDDHSRTSDAEYVKAERLGRRGGDCARAFSECRSSPMQQISAIFDLS